MVSLAILIDIFVQIYKNCIKIKTFSQKINKDTKAMQKYLNFGRVLGTI